jgi:outer membrane protein assembly factor BamB
VAVHIGTIVSLACVLLAESLVAGGVEVARHRGGHTPSGPDAVEAGVLPWQLNQPISRAVVLPYGGTKLAILGGLVGGTTSASGIYSLDTATGGAGLVGGLAMPLHDAAGARLAGHDFIFGGGSPTTTAAVQSWPGPGPAGLPAGGSRAGVVSSLPQPRSDAVAASVGKTIYVVGGYDGSSPDPEVLATSDGHTFTNVANLAIPVRYPAVASLGSRLYVFGGQAIAGTMAGQPVNAIQMVDPAHHRVSVIGRMTEPLMGASAVILGGHLYLMGGDSTTPQVATPGIGTTQFGTSTSSTNPGVGASGALPDAYSVPAAGSQPRVNLAATTPTLSTVSTIWAFDPATHRLLVAGRLQVPVANAGVAAIGSRAWIVGGETGSNVTSAVQMITPNRTFGVAGKAGAGSPYFGDKLLVADRGNNRLLLMDDTNNVVWTYPSPSAPTDPLDFYFPDDAFFIDKGKAIISNQEENETIVEIAYPSGKIIWSYGHPKQPGTAPGFLHEPDDAYLLRNGQISVADAQNCRVLVLNANGTVAHQIGTTLQCVHKPPTSMGSPNGDTPLSDGNLLVSEINGSWVSEYTPTGNLVWTTHLPISYPSDPQQLGANLYLLADYAKPGEMLEFNRQGQIVYRYAVSTGQGALNHPSLAEMLPSGVIMANDDYRNRMVAIDPSTGALVWQYGVNDQAGTGPGLLNTPDGFDILQPNGVTPTHLATG